MGSKLLKHRRNMLNDSLSYGPRKKKFNGKKFLREVRNYLLIIFVAIIAGYSFTTFMFQTVQVVGPSMNDVLEDGETVAINKITYKLGDVKRYDIVAYQLVDNDEYYDIKRVIALPGETVQIKDGYIYVNGKQLNCPYISEKILSEGVAQEEITLDKSEYFVMGDNVNSSEDSRFSNIGNINSSEIKGKVFYVLDPKDNRGKVK